jgi:hypothetical protein
MELIDVKDLLKVSGSGHIATTEHVDDEAGTFFKNNC